LVGCILARRIIKAAGRGAMAEVDRVAGPKFDDDGSTDRPAVLRDPQISIRTTEIPASAGISGLSAGDGEDAGEVQMRFEMVG
jgi:hypothetical protein